MNQNIYRTTKIQIEIAIEKVQMLVDRFIGLNKFRSNLKSIRFLKWKKRFYLQLNILHSRCIIIQLVVNYCIKIFYVVVLKCNFYFYL